MREKLIETEIRAEVLPDDYENIKKRIEANGKLLSQTRRLSVMYFGTIDTRQIDIRVRVTNGECEVVVKLGAFGAHDRIEVIQKIFPSQFLGMIKIFAQFNFTTKIGERNT